MPEPPTLIPPPVELPPVELPPVELPPVVPPEELSPEELPPLPIIAPPRPPPSSSLSLLPPHATATSVAPNANVAARPSRRVGRTGAGLFARSSATPQKGHAASDTRTCRSHPGQGTKWAISERP